MRDATQAKQASVPRPPRPLAASRKLGRPTLSDEALLDVALELFLESGFERTSVDAIASAAGMAKRTIYARYPDKKNLFRSALSRAIDEWIVPVERLQEQECEDLRETLLGIGKILVANILSPAGLRLFRLTNTVSGFMPEIAAANVRQGTEPTVAFLADLFARRLDLAEYADFDAREAAHAFINLVVGGPSSMAAWGVRFDQTELERHTRSSINLFLNGLLPRAGDLEWRDDENRRLRQLLTDALLENVALKEASGFPTK
jgi:AcrR family transcriptional regulator